MIIRYVFDVRGSAPGRRDDDNDDDDHCFVESQHVVTKIYILTDQPKRHNYKMKLKQKINI
jgi:hypothetical protein